MGQKWVMGLLVDDAHGLDHIAKSLDENEAQPVKQESTKIKIPKALFEEIVVVPAKVEQAVISVEAKVEATVEVVELPELAEVAIPVVSDIEVSADVSSITDLSAEDLAQVVEEAVSVQESTDETPKKRKKKNADA